SPRRAGPPRRELSPRASFADGILPSGPLSPHGYRPPHDAWRSGIRRWHQRFNPMMTQRWFSGLGAFAAMALLALGGCEKQVQEARSTTQADGRTTAVAAADAAVGLSTAASPTTQPVGD